MKKRQQQAQEDVPYYLRKETWELSYPEQYLLGAFRAMEPKMQEEMLVMAKEFGEQLLRQREHDRQVSAEESRAFERFLSSLIRGNAAA